MKPRFKRELKFRLSTEHLNEQTWLESELVPVWNKSRNGGVALLQPATALYMIPFEATKPAVDTTGRSKPIICDFCFTWQTGDDGGFVTFYPDKKSDNSVSLLCCMDLRCSDNVRTKTPAALRSRAQLREHMTNETRVERLQQKLHGFIERIGLEPITIY